MTELMYLNIVPILCGDDEDDEWEDYDFESYNTPCGYCDDDDEDD